MKQSPFINNIRFPDFRSRSAFDVQCSCRSSVLLAHS